MKPSAPVLEADIVAFVHEHGPQTGAAVRAAVGAEEQPFSLWKICRSSPLLATRRVGRRYLRLDEKVEGYARLSPSILREFLTYSLVGPADDLATLEQKTHELAAWVRDISAAKLRIAERLVGDVIKRLPAEEAGADLFAVLLAGDIVYEMAHDAPRPERSTGQMVRGSDLDLVVILDDAAPASLEQALDDAIYQQKYRYLINPSTREEIDYTIKRLARVRGQAAFTTFKEMVPCKILDEAVLLAGSRRLFGASKALLAERGIPERLAELERLATLERETAEARLLEESEALVSDRERSLFCGTEETEEFE